MERSVQKFYTCECFKIIKGSPEGYDYYSIFLSPRSLFNYLLVAVAVATYIPILAPMSETLRCRKLYTETLWADPPCARISDGDQLKHSYLIRNVEMELLPFLNYVS